MVGIAGIVGNLIGITGIVRIIGNLAGIVGVSRNCKNSRSK